MEEKLIVGGSLMHADKKPDFSGWATKAGIKCSDGRTIEPGAFKHQDKATVPLVWQHNHNDPGNVLGHVLLEHRDEGVYCHGFFNESTQAQNAKQLVSHNDIKALSIFANQLMEKASSVMHGIIREVSLVLAGANPGAMIDNIALQHGDELVTIDDEAVIYTGLELVHADGKTATPPAPKEGEKKTDDGGDTVQDVYDSMSEEQKNVVHYMVGAALEGASTSSTDNKTTEHSGTASDDSKTKEGTHMTRNVFEQNADKNGSGSTPKRHELSHDAIKGIVADAQRVGSLKEAVEDYALKHGITDIDLLFPDFKALQAQPDWETRRIQWVQGVLSGVGKTPFSRIKTMLADLTQDEARAKGYIKGNLKKEEWFGVTKRTTGPSTVYKKQQLDRDDILDITDFDVVAWLKIEMRLMLDEEIARAVLIGDGREVDDEDKIKDPIGANDGVGIRSILNDNELYAYTANVPWAGDAATDAQVLAAIDEVTRAMRFYKGTGSPTFYTTLPVLNQMLLVRDTQGRRYYRTPTDLASEMGVAAIVTVEVMEGEAGLLGIIVNLRDYNIGADKGGEVNMFDDFDIDYNQYKYLIETRISGALTKIRSAIILKSTDAANVLLEPAEPTQSGNNIDGLNQAHVTYTVTDANGDAVTVTAGVAPIADAAHSPVTVVAAPASGYYFEDNVENEWMFEYQA